MKYSLWMGIDEQCLGQFVANLAIFYNRSHGTHLTVDDFTSYSFWEVWGGTREAVEFDVTLYAQCAKIIDAFFEDPLFTDGVGVVVACYARYLLSKVRSRL